jgi:hypothetical protein
MLSKHETTGNSETQLLQIMLSCRCIYVLDRVVNSEGGHLGSKLLVLVKAWGTGAESTAEGALLSNIVH